MCSASLQHFCLNTGFTKETSSPLSARHTVLCSYCLSLFAEDLKTESSTLIKNRLLGNLVEGEVSRGVLSKNCVGMKRAINHYCAQLVWTKSPKATQQVTVVYNVSLAAGTRRKTDFQKSFRNSPTHHKLASLTSFQNKLLKVTHCNKT